MSDIPGYLAVGVAVGSIGWTEYRVRSTTKARRAVGPAPDTRAALLRARKDFDSIVAHGGQTVPFFMDEERNETGRHLHDLADRTSDHALAVKIVEASVAWDNAWAYAVPDVPAFEAYMAQAHPEDAERRRRIELQLTIAREGRELCQQAIDRLNELAPTA
jgi:hypothetical protein